MRALFITSCYFPDPDEAVHGVFQRMYMFMEALGRVAGEIDVLMPSPPDATADPEWSSRLRRHLERAAGKAVNLFFAPQAPACAGSTVTKVRWYLRTLASPFVSDGPAQARALQDCLDRKPDFIFAHRLPAMSRAVRAQAGQIPVFFDLDDVEHWKAARAIPLSLSWRLRAFQAVSVLPLVLAEGLALKAAARTYVCSERDRKYLARVFLRSNVDVAANCAMPRRSEIPDAKAAVFVGYLGYWPNKVAVDRLVEEIWPRVLERVPDATLTIVGSGREHLRRGQVAPPGVTFAGFVEDLDAVYRGARVVCAPITVGGGTRIKIVEGAAHGRPVVSTRLGAEGLNLRDGAEILIRDDADAFARACVALLTDKALCARIGTAAQQKVAQEYDRERVIAGVCRGIEQEVFRRSGSAAPSRRRLPDPVRARS